MNSNVWLEAFRLILADIAKQNELLLIANQWNLWDWKLTSGKPTLIKDDVEFPSIGSTKEGVVYLHIGNAHELCKLDTGSLKLLQEHLFLKEFADSSDSSSLLLVGEDSSVDQDAPIFRLTADRLSAVEKVNTSFLIDMVEWQPGVFYYTQEGQSNIVQHHNGASVNFKRGLASPSLLATSKSYLYCLAVDKKKIYRLNATGALWRAELVEQAGAPLFHVTSDVRGFASTERNTLLITDEDSIVEIDPERLLWNSVRP